jgi:trimethyllysine dioxygenase
LITPPILGPHMFGRGLRNLVAKGFITPFASSHRCITTSFSAAGEIINFTFDDGKRASFDSFWLRDHCTCDECMHPVTKQRILATFDIRDDITPVNIKKRDGTVWVDWGDHCSPYDEAWLKNMSEMYREPSLRVSHPKLWGNHVKLPAVDFQDFMQRDKSLWKWLEGLSRYGAALIENVQPADEATTQKASERICHLRNSIFGTSWEFTADGAIEDLAYSNVALDAHNDGTYCIDSPGIQVFHCTNHDGDGGETLLVDGFNCANQLSPEHYDILKTFRSPGQYISPTVHMRADGTIIREDSLGNLLQIRWNNEDRAPLMRSHEESRKFYAALKAFNTIVSDKKNQLWFKLNPGTILYVDNWRVMHGRSAFTGSRSIAGSYMGFEDVYSRLRVLQEQFKRVL